VLNTVYKTDNFMLLMMQCFQFGKAIILLRYRVVCAAFDLKLGYAL